MSTERPGVEEAYTAAANATSLRVEADRGGDADLLIAAGWSASRIGAALLRLHSEWDAAEKPQRPAPGAIEALANSLPRVKRGALLVPDMAQAVQMASAWHAQECRQLVARLKTLPDVRRELIRQADAWGIGGADELVPAVMRHWLDQVCGRCHGRRWQVAPGAPVLSNRACTACGGTGVAHPPGGQSGRKLLNFMDDCVQIARAGIKKRLRAASA